MKNQIEVPVISVSSFSKEGRGSYLLNSFAMSEADGKHPKIILDFPNIVNDVIFGIS